MNFILEAIDSRIIRRLAQPVEVITTFIAGALAISVDPLIDHLSTGHTYY